MKKNDIVKLKIDRFKTLNRTVAYENEMPVFIKGGMPGQSIEAKIKRKRNNICEAELYGIICPADYETKTSCESYNICGGCSFLSMPYDMQLKHKEEYIKNLFKENFINYKSYEGIYESPKIYGYRNKMEFAFGNCAKDAPLTLGMHKRNCVFDIVSSESCELIDNDFKIIIKNVIIYCRDKNYTYYYRRSHKGLLRHLILRKGEFTNQIMVNIVVTSQQHFDTQAFVNMLLSLNLENKITSVICTINDSVSDAIKAQDMNILYGTDHIEEKCLSKTFIISPFSFYQTNSAGCEVLYSVAKNMLKDIKCEILFDLYCGTGTIAQILSDNAKKVIGVELICEAVISAKQNAELNNIKNCEFICGDVLNVIGKLKDNPDIIVLDPPRSGIHPKALSKISSFGAKHILYISCNPTALVKDLKYFTEHSYDVDKLAVVDMFPHTPHVECVTLMSRVKD